MYSTVYSGADQRKHQSSASLAFVRGIHRGPVTRKMFPFDDVFMFGVSLSVVNSQLSYYDNVAFYSSPGTYLLGLQVSIYMELCDVNRYKRYSNMHIFLYFLYRNPVGLHSAVFNANVTS